MGRYKDLIGQKFGKLTVIALDEERTEKSLEERRKKIRARSRVYWNCLCDCGNMKSVRQDSLISGKIKTCTKCNTISKIPKFLEEWDFDKNEISPSSVTVTSDELIWWKCPKGHSYQTRIKYRHFNNVSCPYCSDRKVLRGYNDLNTTRPDLTQYLYNVEDGYKIIEHSDKIIKTKCPICGRLKEIRCCDLARVNKNSVYPCICCSNTMSFPELFMSNVLSQLNIEFETQKMLEGKRYLYDFYIKSSNIIIETHGSQHYEEHGFSKLSGITLDQQQKRDKEKEDFAKQQGINYIIIDCRNTNCDYMKNSIINSKLSKIYDLTNIKWEECCQSINMVKLISEKWNEGFTIKELVKHFNKSKATIIKYLKIGTFAHLCNYSKNEAIVRGNKKK